jgi:hypothetical protein
MADLSGPFRFPPWPIDYRGPRFRFRVDAGVSPEVVRTLAPDE